MHVANAAIQFDTVDVLRDAGDVFQKREHS
jgi:hypothetical protein